MSMDEIIISKVDANAYEFYPFLPKIVNCLRCLECDILKNGERTETWWLRPPNDFACLKPKNQIKTINYLRGFYGPDGAPSNISIPVYQCMTAYADYKDGDEY